MAPVELGVVQLVRRLALQDGEPHGQRDVDALQRQGEDEVPREVVGGERRVDVRVLGEVVDEALERGAGQDEAGAAVGEGRSAGPGLAACCSWSVDYSFFFVVLMERRVIDYSALEVQLRSVGRRNGLSV